MMASVNLSVLLALALAGFHDHHAPRIGGCDVCGVASAEVQVEIIRLQTCPRWRDRDDAAHELREFDWRCHPEVAEALVAAMLHDPHEEVREEAAESLAKLSPCLPRVHEALTRAAACDPDHATRKWARRGLKALGNRCVAACGLCEPGGVPLGVPADAGPPVIVSPPTPTSTPVPAPGPRYPATGEPFILPPGEPVPPEIVLPPTDLPAIPPAASPFAVPSSARREAARVAVRDQDEEENEPGPNPNPNPNPRRRRFPVRIFWPPPRGR